MYLREVEKNDIEIINKWRADKDLIDCLGANYRYINIDVDNNWYDNYLKNRNNTIRCAIIDEKKLVGVVYLTNIDYINRNAEFHIMIGEKCNRGKGYGLYGTKELIDYAFSTLNMHKIYLTVLEDNEAAYNLYKKIGFKKEGILRQNIFKNNEYYNQIMMSILKKEFYK